MDVENDNANVVIENRGSNSINSTDSLYSPGHTIGISSDTSQHGSYIPVITTDSADDDELPSLALENIYSFLSRTDPNPDSNFSLKKACHKFVMTRVQVCHKVVMTRVQACSKLAAS
ncbi:hypothetical protein AVEN_249134-1 [Araneus ventricosus]|uniref:Uncharacterized protein n=1 Tax=Araneus ventricosus TaxID=182803 RepID=A0A4Y2D5K8_ARAVE|nr:hypothetical protein AVEN_249134-1 [Araneus ventricosus]